MSNIFSAKIAAHTQSHAQTNVQSKQSYLSAVTIFQDLSTEEMQQMAKTVPMKKVDTGTIFYSPEDSAEVLFILKEGRVKLYQLSTEGKTLTTHIYESGSIFGEMSLVGQAMHGSFAQALTPCILCLMSRDNVKQVLFGDQRIAMRVAETLGERLHTVENRLLDFAFRRVPERLARLLLQLAQPHRALFSRSQRMEVRYTHEELADMIGTTRETVTKLLNQMRTLKLVELKRGCITLLDLHALQQIGLEENHTYALSS